MLGYNLVILWLIIFSILSYILTLFLNIKTKLLCVIFVWTFLMVFVYIFEILLLFHYSYLEKKGKYYYEESKCYWLEDNKINDIFSYKMYMDLYADYSLSDKRYCENFVLDEGNRFVLLGEVIHGFFCVIMTSIILYLFFFNYNEIYIYISSIIFSSIQFAIIIWYLASVFLEMKYKKNEQFWPYPLLWNVPWIILPLYIIYHGIIEIYNKCK